VIKLRRIDHVALGTEDLDAAADRWSKEFALTVRRNDGRRALLSCEDEPYSLELVQTATPGHLHTAFELARECTTSDAAGHLNAMGVPFEERDGALFLSDPDGRGIELMPYRAVDPFVAHARPSALVRPGAPRRLGHVNCLTSHISESHDFYIDVLGMKVTDWLGRQGCWFRINADHHVMALIDTGYSHFHHLAFEVVDIGQMRDMLDRLSRHGRWLGWGPTRHGIGGNVASYVRIVEEECFCELYCDMEVLEIDHEPRVYPDNRFSSNTWGPLPPRSYFRFDEAAIESERESLEMLGVPLEPLEREVEA
jgi:catechol 2,3-dioxygenase-like lactoylglutathione lyase family enzyme